MSKPNKQEYNQQKQQAKVISTPEVKTEAPENTTEIKDTPVEEVVEIVVEEPVKEEIPPVKEEAPVLPKVDPISFKSNEEVATPTTSTEPAVVLKSQFDRITDEYLIYCESSGIKLAAENIKYVARMLKEVLTTKDVSVYTKFLKFVKDHRGTIAEPTTFLRGIEKETASSRDKLNTCYMLFYMATSKTPVSIDFDAVASVLGDKPDLVLYLKDKVEQLNRSKSK